MRCLCCVASQGRRVFGENTLQNRMGKRKIASSNNTSLTNEQLAAEMMDKQTAKSTKRAYAGKVKIFIDWCKVYKAEAINADQKVIIPMDTRVVVEFFGFLTIPATERGQLSSPADLDENDVDPPSYNNKNELLCIYISN